MALLLLFGLIAGAATAISPCALPVLPVVFAAGATGGRRRPAGIATGLAVSFTVATVLLVYLISAFGLPDGLLRTFAIAVLLVFGLSLLVPGLSARIEGWISRMTAGTANRVAEATGIGEEPKDGFWSGVAIGSGLGLVYAPCAGPILAGVITVSASQSFSAGRLAVALAYGVGSALTFYALMLGGRRLITPLAKRSQVFQYAMGLVMVFIAVAMFANLDTRFQTAIANDLPSVLVNPTEKLEDSKSSQDAIADLVQKKSPARVQTRSASGRLPDIAPAPDFIGNQRWFNTPGGRPLSRADLHGKVYLVDFWTYTCINCIRTLPYLKAWYAKYKNDGFTIVGVHSPEFSFEKSAGNVQAAIRQNGLRYPVAQDNELKTWDAFQNQYWPAHYLIDAGGTIRYIQYGEGDYAKTEAAIRELLRANGAKRLGSDTSVRAESASNEMTSPETYLGAARAEGFSGTQPSTGTTSYGNRPIKLDANGIRIGGTWSIGQQRATAGPGAFIDFETVSRRTFLVLGSPGAPRRMQVLLDGRPISDAQAGSDVHGGYVTISPQRLYRLVNLPRVETHLLTLRPAPGISAYAFTFG